MIRPVDILTESMMDCLSRAILSIEDFAEMAATGEQLRRCLGMLENPPARALEALARYDALLPGLPAEFVPDLEPILEESLAALVRFAGTAPQEQDENDGRRRLDHLDEILSVAVAGYRGGKLGIKVVESLGARAKELVSARAARLSLLWQYAEDMELSFGPDPDVHRLFDFWEELACLAQSRLDMEQALALRFIDPVRRSALVERVMARYAPQVQQSVGDKILEWIEKLDRLYVQWPQLAAQASFSSGTGAGGAPVGKEAPTRVEILLEIPDALTVLRREASLIIEVPEGHLLALRSASVGSKEGPSGTNIGKNCIAFPVGDIEAGSSICLRIEVDGKPVDLPAIVIANPHE
jgi:hypothetical protein